MSLCGRDLDSLRIGIELPTGADRTVEDRATGILVGEVGAPALTRLEPDSKALLTSVELNRGVCRLVHVRSIDRRRLRLT
jgi:hypothetical protein